MRIVSFAQFRVFWQGLELTEQSVCQGLTAELSFFCTSTAGGAVVALYAAAEQLAGSRRCTYPFLARRPAPSEVLAKSQLLRFLFSEHRLLAEPSSLSVWPRSNWPGLVDVSAPGKVSSLLSNALAKAQQLRFLVSLYTSTAGGAVAAICAAAE